jgi:hypothetical protein
MESEMLIKIARIGTRILQVNHDCRNVGDALTLAGLSFEGMDVRVNGIKINRDHAIENGDVITLIPAGGIRGEATFKVAGNNWRIHQNDPDKMWPSDLHAHNQICNETLDLYTGRIYNPETKQFIRKMPRKQLDRLLEKLPRRLIQIRYEPPN